MSISFNRREWLQAICLLVLSTVKASVQAFPATFELRAITSEDNIAKGKILQALVRRYPSMQVSSNVEALVARKGPGIYLAIGPGALRSALAAQLDGPLISLFTSSHSYKLLISQRRPTAVPGHVTAIFAEASPYHQMQLIARLYGRRVPVGVLVTDSTSYLEPMLRDGARAAGLDMVVEKITDDANINRALLRIEASHVLVLIPDSKLYTSENIRNVLEAAYRRGQAVIGFSAGLVAAGTLAAAYSTIEDILEQLDELLELLASGRLPATQYPRYWRVAINDSVARSLNVVVDESVRVLGQRPAGK